MNLSFQVFSSSPADHKPLKSRDSDLPCSGGRDTSHFTELYKNGKRERSRDERRINPKTCIRKIQPMKNDSLSTSTTSCLGKSNKVVVLKLVFKNHESFVGKCLRIRSAFHLYGKIGGNFPPNGTVRMEKTVVSLWNQMERFLPSANIREFKKLLRRRRRRRRRERVF